MLIVRHDRIDELRPLDLARLPPIKLTVRNGGRGDIRFGLPQYSTGKGGRKIEVNRSTPALSTVPHLIDVSDVAAVHALIVRTAQARTEAVRG